MLKRNFIMSLVLLGLTFCVVTSECFADAAAQLEQADAYFEAGNYVRAEQIYKTIIQNYPDSDEAMEAHQQLGVLYIFWESQPQAKQALEGLLNGFSGHPGITKAVREVCNAYIDSERYERASEFFQYFLDQELQDNISIWLKAGLIRGKIAFGDFPAAEVLFQEMFAEFGVDDELLADVLTNIAHSYFYAEKYERANQLYTEAMNKGPDELDEMWTVMGLGMSRAALGDNAEADLVVERLVTDFTDQPDIAEAVLSIADTYFDLAKAYEKANELFRYISKTWPDSETAVMAQAGLAKSSIAIGDNSAAESQIGKLLTDFSDDNRLAGALKLVADSYLEVLDYENANLVYSQALDKGLEDADAIWAVMGIGMSNAALGNHAEAGTCVERLITDFSWYPEIGLALSNIAEKYYEEALQFQAKGLEEQASSCFQVALGLADIVKRDFPEYANKPEIDADMYMWEGTCYEGLGEYEDAIDCYQEMVDNYPEHYMASDALFMIGRGYEKLKETGTLSESQADLQITAVYERLIADYPNSNPVKIAERWLNEHSSN